MIMTCIHEIAFPVQLSRWDQSLVHCFIPSHSFEPFFNDTFAAKHIYHYITLICTLYTLSTIVLFYHSLLYCIYYYISPAWFVGSFTCNFFWLEKGLDKDLAWWDLDRRTTGNGKGKGKG